MKLQYSCRKSVVLYEYTITVCLSDIENTIIFLLGIVYARKASNVYLLINKVKHTVDLCTFLNNKRRGKQCT